MKKIPTLLFGGSFDPIHNGHLTLARYMLQHTSVEEVWFMVSPCNPLKQSLALTSEDLRFCMVERALCGERGMKASNFEFHLPRPSYTIHTLKALEKSFPNRTFSLLIGADNYERFAQWYSAEEIMKSYPIWVYPRGGSSMEEPLPSPSSVVKLTDAPLMEVSSTCIRALVAKGISPQNYLPACVQQFIEEHQLYKM